MRLIVFFIVLMSATANFAQIQKKWLGHYVGELSIYSISGTRTVYHMELIFKELNATSYEWTIIYGEDSLRQERKYILLDKGDNLFEIDEQNGIILSCNLIGNQFVSTFEVANNLIHATYTFGRKDMHFDLTSSTSKYNTGTLNPSDSAVTQLVISYQTTTVQKAILKRK